MTQISAEIIADSINTAGQRITTAILTFPRFVLAELNTHRAFSRNSASSRAIPFNKMVEMVKTDPFIPIAWQKNHKGMQGTEYLDKSYNSSGYYAEYAWLEARNRAVDLATSLDKLDVTKQLTNRLLEPFLWHRVLVTSTEWGNFFELRCPQYEITYKVGGDEKVLRFRSRKDFLAWFDRETTGWTNVEGDFDPHTHTEEEWLMINRSGAEIHISRLAECMWDALNESTPKILQEGEWHIPFGDNINEDELFEIFLTESDQSLEEEEEALLGLRLNIATARCARTSYNNFEGNSDFMKDILLYNTLLSSKHMSPFEHCAQAAPDKQSRNFYGFTQYRAIVEEREEEWYRRTH